MSYRKIALLKLLTIHRQTVYNLDSSPENEQIKIMMQICLCCVCQKLGR